MNLQEETALPMPQDEPTETRVGLWPPESPGRAVVRCRVGKPTHRRDRASTQPARTTVRKVTEAIEEEAEKSVTLTGALRS